MTDVAMTLPDMATEPKRAKLVPRPEADERQMLCFDFDGVVVNTLKTLVQIALNMGKAFPPTVTHTSELTLAKHGWSTDEVKQLETACFAGHGAHHNEPLLGAVEGLRTLEQYFRIVIVTARSGQALANARIILRNLGLGHLQIVGERGSAEMKASTLEEFGGIFAFVEDSPANLVAAWEHATYLYLVRWPYNDVWTEHRHRMTEYAAAEAWPRLVASLIQRAKIDTSANQVAA